MKKLLLLTKTLLAAALLCVGQNAWAVDVNFAAKERISVNGDGWKASDKAGNKYALAIADLTGVSGISDAGKVTIEFDVQMNSGGRWLIGIGDKAVRGETAGTSDKSTYSTDGLVCRFGTSDGTYYRVNGSGNYDAFGKRVHVTFSLNRVTGKYSLVLLDTSSDTELYNQSGVSTSVSNATIIEAYSWNKNDETLTYLQSASVTVAPIYSYTIKAIDGSSNVLKTFDTGSYIVGDDAITYNYPQKLLIGNTLYSASDSKSKDFNISFTPNTNDYTANVSYSGTSVSNVIYYSEAENISGVSSSSDQAYASMKKVGRTYTAGDPEVYKNIITLPAGTYKIYARGVNSNSADRTCNFKVGDEVKWTFTITKSSTGIVSTGSSADITVASDAMLSFSCGASNQSGLDWIYITGTPTNEIVGAVDYSTGYLDDMTNKVTLSPGESYNYKFINHNSGSSSQWLNYVVPVYTSADVKTLVIRSDNWEDVKGTSAGCTNNFVWGDANATFIEEMNGATVDMTISYNASNVLTMNAAIKTKSGYDWTYSYRTDYSESGISLEGDIKVALSVSNSWLELAYEGTTGTVSKTITAAEWATYCSPYALDLEHATGLTDAYIVTGATGNVLKTTSVKGGTIPANTGILIEAPAGTVTIPVVVSSSTDVSGNKFQGVTEATEIAANAGYVLMADPKVGFYKNANAFTVGANTAYLPADFAGLARSAFFFGGNITAVDNVVAAAEAKAKEGKFIENGKLVIVKNGQKFNAAGAQVK